MKKIGLLLLLMVGVLHPAYADIFDYAREGNLAGVKELVKNVADINAFESYDGETVLMIATYNGHLEIVKFLIENGADINITMEDDSGTISALILASREGYTEIVKYLLKNGADVNIQNEYEETALSRAKLNRNEKIVKLLIKAGAK